MAYLFDIAHEWEWLLRLLAEVGIATVALINDRLHRARLKQLREELNERSQEAEAYLTEFEKMDTPPPRFIKRKRRQG